MRTPLSALPVLLLLGALTLFLPACDGDGSPFRKGGEGGGGGGSGGGPVVQFEIDGERLHEREGPVPIAVTLSEPAPSQLELPFSVTGSARPGADYVVSTPSPLVLPEGTTAVHLGLMLLDDNKGEIDESIRITLEAAPGLELGARRHYVLRIEDEEAVDVEEAEPNDQSSDAQGLGFLRIDAGVHVHGQVVPQGGADPFDLSRATVFEDMLLRVALDPWNPVADVAVRILDHSGATLLDLDLSGLGDFEETELAVSGGDELVFEVRVAEAGSDYLLQLAGELPGD